MRYVSRWAGLGCSADSPEARPGLAWVKGQQREKHAQIEFCSVCLPIASTAVAFAVLLLLPLLLVNNDFLPCRDDAGLELCSGLDEP